MSDTAACPSCARPLRVSPHHHGKMVRCPSCSITFGIPSIVSDAPEVPQAIRPAAVAAPQTALAAPRPGPRWAAPSGAEIQFQAEVRHDPEGRVRGKWQARLGEGGLCLRQGEAQLVIVPGAGAAYRKNNVLAVELGGRRVELALVRHGWYQARLARDVAAFLNGDRDVLDPADYPVSRWLYAVALLPLGIPILTQGGALWGGLGGGLAGLCFALILIEKLSVPQRVAACLGVAAAGYAVLFVFHPTLGLVRPAPLDPSLWQTFNSPDGEFEVAFPGRATPQPGAPGFQTVGVELKGGAVAFGVSHGPLPAREVGRVPLKARFDGARQGVLATVPGATVKSERPITVQGNEGRDLVLVVPGKGEIHLRMFASDRRFFLLIGGGRRVAAADIDRFFNSFWLKPALAGPVGPAPDPAPRRAPAVPLPGCRLLAQFDAPSVQCVAVSPDGRLLATAHGRPDRTGTAVRFWDAETGRPAGDTGPARSATRRLAFSRDGRLLAAVGDSGSLGLWDVQTRTVLRELATQTTGFRAVALSADGKRLAATNGDRALVFNLGSGEKEIDLDFPNPQRTYFGIYSNVAFSPDDRRLAVGQLRQVRVIDLETGKETRIRGLSVGALAFTPDGKYLIAGDASQTVTVYDAQALKPVKELRAEGTILTLTVSPDSRTLALATTQEDGAGYRRVVLIDLARFKPVREAPLRGGTIATSLAFAPDGSRLYGAGINVVHVWELDRRRPPG